MKNKKILWLALVVVMLMATACMGVGADDAEEETARLPNLIFSSEGIDKSECVNPEWLETKPVNDEPSDSVDVHVFIDGSSSMRGYLTFSGSTYDRMVTSIPSVCINAFESFNMKAYKVFDDVYQMKNEEKDFRAIGADFVDYVYKKDFYGSEMAVRSGDVRAADKDRADYSAIIDEIKSINPSIVYDGAGNDLYIIVSDFIPQDNRDIDFYRFNSKLYSDILCHDLCCGIAGFKSEFYGDVICLDAKGKSTAFAYKDKMPFYVMAIGETRNVTKFLDEMQARIDHFELDESIYGLFATDGQNPRDVGTGDTIRLRWDEDLAEGLVSEQAMETMVSYELMDLDAFKRGDTLGFAGVYNLFPIDEYLDESSLAGTLCFKLPYELSETSSIVMEDKNWTLKYQVQIVQGERAAATKEIKRIDEDCEGKIAFPSDISEDAFRAIYGGRLPRVGAGEDPILVYRTTWKKQAEAYEAEFEPRILGDEDWFIAFGEGSVEDGVVMIPYTMDTAGMKLDQPYLIAISFTASPKITTKHLDAWVELWDIGYVQMEDWVANPTSISAGRTPGLSRALKALQGERIFDDGYFARQVNLVIAKSEKLAPASVKAVVQSAANEANEKEEEQTEETKTSADGEREKQSLGDWFRSLIK